ncbi:Yip1 family protein [Streptomyces bohaiensis]|uniref:Yip1 family protein n=1 Tax=Streptomyces bohaiensis TaxID=1431344 RepID=UPI003B7AB124
MGGFRNKRNDRRGDTTPGGQPRPPFDGPPAGQHYQQTAPMPAMGHGPHGPGHHGGPGSYGPGPGGPHGPDSYGPGPGGPHGPGGWNEGTTYGHDDPGGPQGPGGDPPPPHPEAYGPRLPWKELLKGLVLRPVPTLWRMRDYPMWAPALIVSFLYGLVAVFGLDDARQTMLDTTASSVVPYLLITGVAMVCGALLLSTVTHMLARQLGGNGHWAPTVGLAMLIMSLTDVPRLLLAIFLGGAATLVQIVGWVTWLYAGVLLTMMVMRSHELPWQRALPACAIQLLALLMLVKLGTF